MCKMQVVYFHVGDFVVVFCQTPVFTFAWDNHKNHNYNNRHLNFVKGTVLGDKEQVVGIRDKG